MVTKSCLQRNTCTLIFYMKICMLCLDMYYNFFPLPQKWCEKFPSKSLNPKTKFPLTSYWCKELEVSVAEIRHFEWRGKYVKFSESFFSPGKVEAACHARND